MPLHRFKANLRDASFCDDSWQWCGADLNGTDLVGANISNANLWGETSPRQLCASHRPRERERTSRQSALIWSAQS
ncbi:pentapeptide repeat-containing protein [Streptomyces sp. NPDC012746]|uniref:pentapeptide repeat-containing protein n=1 Tax=Streptomyces sp. NPDC012746 TaxID=3364845 RepID=UPI0036C8F2F4